MSWWMILLLILGILLLIGCIPVGVDAGYRDETAIVKLKIGFLRVQLLPKKPGKSKKKKAKKNKPPKKDKAKTDKAEKKKPGLLSGGISTIFDLVGLLGDTLGDLRRKLRVEVLTLHVTFGGDDPAAAAISYGRAWTAIGMLTPVFDRLFVIKKRDIQPVLDYNSEKQRIDAQLILTITIGRILSLALRAGFGFLKILNESKKGGATHESSSV